MRVYVNMGLFARNDKQGMTLIEMLIVVSIIGLLALFMIPAVTKGIERRENALVASKLRIAINAFELCKSETGSYPNDVSRRVIPPEMTDYFADLGIDWWTTDNELGAAWDWDKDNNFAFSISFVDPDSGVSEKQLIELDALLESGNAVRGDLTQGTFQKKSTRYHYILEE